ncbi:c-type cytochrome [Silicimonas sp. MF1-12-2]|uniref:c-type cytochrome n=1 Tax=Silicimonas sp. MF1-12-2 TaxID=3384793 RepID=UPI0039B4D78B
MRIPALVFCFVATSAFAAEPDAAEGKLLFMDFCAACHGETAKGDGLMSKALTIPPSDLTQLSLMNNGVFPTFRVVRQIDGRDPMLAHGGDMPLFGEIFDFPDSAIAAETGQPIITAQSIVDIVTWLQTIQSDS